MKNLKTALFALGLTLGVVAHTALNHLANNPNNPSQYNEQVAAKSDG